jgi:hypothetical protein
MSFPTGLFIEDPEMQDVSLTSLSQDPEEWSEEIIQKFKERIPQSSSMSTMIKMMKEDEENGAATGSVIVSNSKKQAIIPIIIKDFMLMPLDVMIINQRLVPLTPDYFNRFFVNNEAFSGLEEYPVFGGLGRFEDANLWNATYPPSLGRYAYASAGFEILDQISDTIDGSVFKDYLIKNPTVAANFHKHGHSEIIKKLANLQPVNMNEFRQGVEALINRPIQVLRRDGSKKYTILSNSDFVFSPVITTGMERRDFEQQIAEVSDCVADTMNEVDCNGEKMIPVPVEPQDKPYVYLAGPVQRTIESANEFDHYVVRNSRGVEHTGVVVPTVINFDMEVLPVKLFLSNTMSTIQPEIAGVRIKNCDYKPEGQLPQPGQTGTFLFMMNKSKGLATIPVTVKSVTSDGSYLKIVVLDLLGVGYQLKIDNNMQDLQRIAKVGDWYLLPGGFQWIPMQGFEQVSNSDVDFVTKSAGLKKSANPVKLIATGFNQYSMKGVNKYAAACGWDHTMLNDYQAKFLLLSLGMRPDDINFAIKQANLSGDAEIHGLNFLPLKSEKIAEAKPLAEKMLKIAKKLKTNLIKEASYMADSQTVDTLLSLNFVNPENISKFVNKIPALKNCISHLASCLIASRLGMSDIPEQAAASAMYRLLDVINGLEAMRAQEEVGQ